jgi:hypothetical protein
MKDAKDTKETISAYVSGSLAKQFHFVVEQEGGKASPVAARALDLYVLLHPETRRALTYLQTQGTEEDRLEFVRELGLAAARLQQRIASRALAVFAGPVEQVGTSDDTDIDAEIAARHQGRRMPRLAAPTPATAR